MSSRISVFSAALCAAVFAAPCIAQIYPTYNLAGSPQTPGLYGGDTYAADLNNDGIPDLIQNEVYGVNGENLPVFAVFIANGDGTFKAPVKYQYPASIIPPGQTGPGYPIPMAFGDFNGDGNMDMALISGANAITVYLGKGDGTYVNPWNSWILSIPSNQYFASFYPDIVAGDFNHDGKVDLAVVGVGPSSNVVYILPGQGSGRFSTAVPVLTVPGKGDASNWGVLQMLGGDFDGDGNADLAVMASVGIGNGNGGSTTVHVIYGDGKFGFADTTPLPAGDQFLYAGDLNSDGKTDLFGIGAGTGSYTLDTYYGQGTRTFASYTQPTIWGGIFSSASVADFNDDGRNDLVGITGNSTGSFLVFYLATSTPGQFEYQTWNVPNVQAATGPGGVSYAVVGDFNRDEKPDWAYVGHTSTGSTIAYSGLNDTVNSLWSNCDYPEAQRGINLCSPAIVSGSTVNFNATAHSLGELRKMELWVDGKKLDEQYHTWEGNGFFNSAATFSAGTHYGTYFASDISNTLQHYNFQFTVPSSCNAPSTAGVRLCWPANGASINSKWVIVEASSTVTGTLARMEAWVDGVKKYTETNSASMSAAVTVSPGTHRFTVFAVNTSGQVWSQAATATIP